MVELTRQAGHHGRGSAARRGARLYRPQRVARAAALAAAVACAGTAQAGAFDCIIEPKQVLELRSPLEGLIEKVNVDRGDVVKAGQVLVVLDASVDRAAAEVARFRSQVDGALESGRSRVDFSSRKFERMRNLYGGNYVSAQSRDEAATEKRLAEAELHQAREARTLAELEYRHQMAVIRLKTIRSPINGVVTERLQNPGELAEAGVGRKAILKIAEIGTLRVEVLLPIEAFGRIKPGSQATVFPEVPRDHRVDARVAVIDRVADAASGTFGVRLELPNPDNRIPGGVRCKVDFPGVDGATRPAPGARSG